MGGRGALFAMVVFSVESRQPALMRYPPSRFWARCLEADVISVVITNPGRPLCQALRFASTELSKYA